MIIGVVIVIIVCVYFFMVKPNGRHLVEADEFKKCRLVAHRGLHDNTSEAVENSLLAFRLAVEAGYGIEMDVQLSKDGIPVVFHDSLLARVARDENNQPVQGKVCDYTYEELLQLHLLDSKEKIPTFKEFLDLVNGQVPLIIELKLDDGDKELAVCPVVKEMLETYHGLYCIESFNPLAVAWYKKHKPNVMRGQLSTMYTKNGKHKPIYYMMEYLLLNFMTKPDFIAYDVRYTNNISRKICYKLFHNTAVSWTIRSLEELEKVKDEYDIFIFEGCKPSKE